MYKFSPISIFSIALLIGITLISGCTSLSLYDKARDEKAAALKKNWETLNSAKIIAGLRGNQAKLLSTELETQERLANALRQHYTRLVLTKPTISEGLVNPVHSQIYALGGPLIHHEDDVPIVNYVKQEEELKKAAERLADAREVFFEITDNEAPQCVELDAQRNRVLGAVPESHRPAATVALAEIQNNCKYQSSLSQTLTARFERQIRGALQAYDDETTAIANARVEVNRLKLHYSKSAAQLEEALRISESPSNDASASKRLATAGTKFSSIVKSIEQLQSSLGRQFIAEDRIARIDAVLPALVGSAKVDDIVDPKARANAAALVIVPNLIDEARAGYAAIRKPFVAPLLLQRRIEELNLQAAKREVQAHEDAAEILRQKAALLISHAVSLELARKQLNKLTPFYKMKAAKAWTEMNEMQRYAFLDATARLVDVSSRGAGEVAKLDYQLIAARHTAALYQSETAVQQWTTLVGFTIEDVSGFYASGIKTGEIVQWLQSAGVIWIGRGVNVK
jgi:hypothetical protein